MSVKSKIIGVLRSVFGIYRDAATQYIGQQTAGTGTRVFGGSSAAYVEVTSAVTLGPGVTDVRADGFANFTITGPHVVFIETSDPSAPSANRGILFARDNGAGKTQLCVRFNTGAVQVIATEP
jgi:hypothetical protein